MRTVVAGIEGELRRCKGLTEAAMDRLPDADLAARVGGTSSSVARIAWHVSGNLPSRLTDLLGLLGHVSYHVRQIAFASRERPGDGGRFLSILPGFREYDEQPGPRRERRRPAGCRPLGPRR